MKIVIVGGGEVGFYFAEWLSSERNEVVVIDKSERAINQMTEHLDVQTLQGSGSSPKVLDEAGIKNADIILAVTDSDEVNLMALYFANLLSPNIHKVALIRNDDYASYQDALTRDIVDISLAINPEAQVVNSVLRLMRAPDVEQINDFVGGRIKMVGKRLSRQSQLDGQRLAQLPEKLGKNRLIVAAVVRDDQLIIPKGKDSLHAGDFVYFVCEDKNLHSILSLFGSDAVAVKDITIVGGGKIGFRLAQELEGSKIGVKLIEMDHQRCQTIAAQLRDTIVLHGYATDAESTKAICSLRSLRIAGFQCMKSTVIRMNRGVSIPKAQAQ